MKERHSWIWFTTGCNPDHDDPTEKTVCISTVCVSVHYVCLCLNSKKIEGTACFVCLCPESRLDVWMAVVIKHRHKLSLQKRSQISAVRNWQRWMIPWGTCLIRSLSPELNFLFTHCVPSLGRHTHRDHIDTVANKHVRSCLRCGLEIPGKCYWYEHQHVLGIKKYLQVKSWEEIPKNDKKVK